MVGESQAHNRKTQLQYFFAPSPTFFLQDCIELRASRTSLPGAYLPVLRKEKVDGRLAKIYNIHGVLRMYICSACMSISYHILYMSAN